MFRLCSQVVAYNISEMRRWIKRTWLLGSSNKHAHCSTETFPSTCGFYSHCEVCIEKITHPPLSNCYFFPRVYILKYILKQECSLNLRKMKDGLCCLMSAQFSLCLCPLGGSLKVLRCSGVKRKRTDLKRDVIIVNCNTAF